MSDDQDREIRKLIQQIQPGDSIRDQMDDPNDPIEFLQRSTEGLRDQQASLNLEPPPRQTPFDKIQAIFNPHRMGFAVLTMAFTVVLIGVLYDPGPNPITPKNRDVLPDEESIQIIVDDILTTNNDPGLRGSLYLDLGDLLLDYARQKRGGKDYRMAENALMNARKLLPDDPRVLDKLAELYDDMGKEIKAERIRKEADALRINQPEK